MAKNEPSDKNELSVIQASDFLALRRPAAETAEIIQANLGDSQVSVFTLDRLKIPAGGGTTWSVPSMDGDKLAPSIVGIIASFQDIRAFWRSSFQGGNSPPDCTSNNGQMGIGNPGGPCAKCPFSQFGSAAQIEGRSKTAKGQACKQCRRLFIIQPGEILPILLSLPPTSLKAVTTYFQRLASKAVPYYGVITEAKLNKTRSASGQDYSEVVLKAVGYLSPEETASVKILHDKFDPIFRTLAQAPNAFDMETSDANGAADTDIEGPTSEEENAYQDNTPNPDAV